jgi:hypothetical protein
LAIESRQICSWQAWRNAIFLCRMHLFVNNMADPDISDYEFDADDIFSIRISNIHILAINHWHLSLERCVVYWLQSFIFRERFLYTGYNQLSLERCVVYWLKSYIFREMFLDTGYNQLSIERCFVFWLQSADMFLDAGYNQLSLGWCFVYNQLSLERYFAYWLFYTGYN